MAYYKLIGNNFGNFPYHLGLNSLEETKEEFDPRPICGKGGLYFTTIEHILAYVQFGDTLCQMRVPEDAQVVQVGRKWKADKIEIVWTCRLDIDWVVRQGADVHTHDDEALRRAIHLNDMRRIQCLLEHGANAYRGYQVAYNYGNATLSTFFTNYLLTHHTVIQACLKLILSDTARADCIQAMHDVEWIVRTQEWVPRKKGVRMNLNVGDFLYGNYDTCYIVRNFQYGSRKTRIQLQTPTDELFWTEVSYEEKRPVCRDTSRDIRLGLDDLARAEAHAHWLNQSRVSNAQNALDK